jgi:hypothetical protein
MLLDSCIFFLRALILSLGAPRIHKLFRGKVKRKNALFGKSQQTRGKIRLFTLIASIDAFEVRIFRLIH